MSEIVRQQAEVVVPTTGEMISLDDPASCARVLVEIDDLERKLRELKSILRESIIDESIRQGTKTLHFPGSTATISTPNDIHWDLEILAELLDAGLPNERYEALVRAEVQYRVDQSVVRELQGANPAYAEIIGRARTRIPKTPSVKVVPGGTK